MAKVEEMKEPTTRELMEQIQKLQHQSAQQAEQIRLQGAVAPARKWANEMGELDRETVEAWLSDPFPEGVFFRESERAIRTLQEEQSAEFVNGRQVKGGKRHISAVFNRYDGVGAELFVHVDSNRTRKWCMCNVAENPEVTISENERQEFGLPSNVPLRVNGRISFTEALANMYQSPDFASGKLITGEAFMMQCRSMYEQRWQQREAVDKNQAVLKRNLGISSQRALDAAAKLGKRHLTEEGANL